MRVYEDAPHQILLLVHAFRKSICYDNGACRLGVTVPDINVNRHMRVNELLEEVFWSAT